MAMMYSIVQILIFVLSTILAVYLLRAYQKQLDALRQSKEELAQRTKELEVGKKRLGLAIEATRMVYWNYNFSTDELSYDQTLLAWLGMNPDHAPHQISAWLALIHPQDQEAFVQQFGAAQQVLGPAVDMEYRITGLSGDWVWVRTKGRVFQRSDSGQAELAGGGTINISERKLAQERLLRSETLLRGTLESSDEGILMTASDGRVLCNNQRFLELWRIPAALAVLGQDELMLTHVSDQLRDPTAFLLRVRQLLEGELQAKDRLYFKDGRVFARFTRALIVDGKKARIWCFRDITEQVCTQDALAEREELFRSIVNQANEGILLVRQDNGTFAEFNEAAHASLGYSREEFASLRIADIQAEHSTEEIARNLQRIKDEGRADFESLHRHKDGSLRNVRVSNRRLQLHEQHYVAAIVSDITERKQAEVALQESEYRWKFALEGSGEGVWDWNLASNTIFFSKRWKAILGYREDEIGNALSECEERYHPDDKDRALGALQAYFEGQTPTYSLELRVRCKQGHYKWILDRGMVVSRSPDGRPLRMLGTYSDITERKLEEEKLRLAASVFENSREGITITDPEGTILDVNDAFTRITGFSREEALGQNPRILSSGRQGKEFYQTLWRSLSDKGHWYGEIWNQRKTGEVYAEMLNISAVRDFQGVTRQFVALFSDITVLVEHQNKLEHLAHYDALTGLPNRVLLADRLQHGMAQSLRRGQRLAVAFLDLDGFKSINDSFGHEAGDQLLICVSERMKQVLRDGDTLARMGGDEFVAVLVDLDDVEGSLPTLTRLLEAAAQPVLFGAATLQVSASLGITFFPQYEDLNADQLMRQADQAMYQAKVAGKNRYHVFNAEQDRSLRAHLDSLERIRLAMERHELILYYQPKVHMRSGKIIGLEAFIRWQHPLKGLLEPAEFLHQIENHPLGVDLGEWVIETALTQMEQWLDTDVNLSVSVNIGARQLQQANFAARLRAILAAHPRIDPARLELEVLETSTIDDVRGVARGLEEARSLGVTLALDDFGTGYSSLTYLKRLPIGLLKIGPRYVSNMLTDPDDLVILEAILGLATTFGRQVIAEGVDSIEQGRLLLQMGCEWAQGFIIARPMPACDINSWRASWKPDPAWVNQSRMRREDFTLLYAAVEHRAWVLEVLAYLNAERPQPPPLGSQDCRFGLWMGTQGLDRFRDQPGYVALDALHQKVHAVAHFCELGAQGHQTQPSQTRHSELLDLRDALLEQLDALHNMPGTTPQP